MTGPSKNPSLPGPDGRDLMTLIQAFQGGRRESFDPLYELLWPPVVRRARRLGLDTHTAEEIAQKVLVRVYLYAGRASFGRPGQIWAWVYTIATREVYKSWRRKRPDVVSGEALEVWASTAADTSPPPSAAAASAEALEAVDQCIASLDEAGRMVLLGVLVGDLTFRQAAKAHGLTLGQFKHRYEKALALVRRCMQSKGHDLE